jgi:hypothetical protein
LLIRQIAQTLFVVLEVLRVQNAKLLSVQIESDSTEVIQKLAIVLDIGIAKDEQLLILQIAPKSSPVQVADVAIFPLVSTLERATIVNILSARRDCALPSLSSYLLRTVHELSRLSTCYCSRLVAA